MDKKISIEEWKKRREMTAGLDAKLQRQGINTININVNIETGVFEVHIKTGTSLEKAPFSHKNIPVRYFHECQPSKDEIFKEMLRILRDKDTTLYWAIKSGAGWTQSACTIIDAWEEAKKKLKD